MKNQKETSPCRPSKSKGRVVDVLHSEQTCRRPSTVTSGYRVKKVSSGMCKWIMWRCGSWLNRGMAGQRTLSFSAARIKKGRRAEVGVVVPAETWPFIGRQPINLQRWDQNRVRGHTLTWKWRGGLAFSASTSSITVAVHMCRVYMNYMHVEFELHVVLIYLFMRIRT